MKLSKIQLQSIQQLDRELHDKRYSLKKNIFGFKKNSGLNKNLLKEEIREMSKLLDKLKSRKLTCDQMRHLDWNFKFLSSVWKLK